MTNVRSSLPPPRKTAIAKPRFARESSLIKVNQGWKRLEAPVLSPEVPDYGVPESTFVPFPIPISVHGRSVPANAPARERLWTAA